MFKNFMKLIFSTLILCLSTALTMKNSTSILHQNKYVSDNSVQASKCKKKFKSKCPQEKKQTIMDICRPFQFGIPICSFVGCRKKFESVEDLLEHMYEKHTEKNLKQCLFPKCKKCSDTVSHLKGHMFRHFTEKYFFCPTCSRLFKWPKDLKAHLETYEHKPHISSPSNSNVNKKKSQVLAKCAASAFSGACSGVSELKNIKFHTHRVPDACVGEPQSTYNDDDDDRVYHLSETLLFDPEDPGDPDYLD